MNIKGKIFSKVNSFHHIFSCVWEVLLDRAITMSSDAALKFDLQNNFPFPFFEHQLFYDPILLPNRISTPCENITQAGKSNTKSDIFCLNNFASALGFRL